MNELWQILNSPAVIAFVAVMVIWLLNRLYAKKPAWKKYEGAIITAIKYAEKQVPDDSTSSGVSKLNTALQYAVNVFEEMQNRRPNSDEVHELKEGIQIKHAEMK